MAWYDRVETLRGGKEFEEKEKYGTCASKPEIFTACLGIHTKHILRIT